MKQFKRLSVVIITICISLTSIFAQSAGGIFSADEPIYYGDENFRARIFEQTRGERSPVGLVLSGGSARAFAHIGVLEYLEEEGIVPDFIISNSMGSIVGMLYAAGLSPKQIHAAVSEMSIETLFDMTMPVRGGLLDSSRFLSYVSAILGGSPDLSELPIPIIVITEDLVTRRQVIISEGDFLTVLQASFALPVYFEPVKYNGHLLIDGGITNLVPVDLAYDYADSVIVSTTFYEVDDLNLLNPITVLNVAVDISKRRQGVIELKAHLDEAVWIRNDVENVSFMEFGEVDYLSKKGYESATKQSEALKDLPSRYAPNFMAIRQEGQKKLEAAWKRYHYFEHIPVVKYSDLWGASLTQYNNRRLTNEMNLGLSYAFGLQNLRVETSLGLMFGLPTNDVIRDPFIALGAGLEYYPFGFLRTAVNGTVGYGFGKRWLFEVSGVTEGGFYAWQKQLRLNFALSFEYLGVLGGFHQDWLGHQTLLYFSTLGELNLNQRDVPWHMLPTRLEASYQLLSKQKVHRSFIYFDSASGMIHRPTRIFGELQLWGRFALDGQGDVPLLPTDSYRTRSVGLKSQGRMNLLSTPNDAPFLIGLNTTVGWKPFSKNMSVAETLLFKETSIGIYSDLLFSRVLDAPNVSLGVEVRTEASLLGIKSLPTTLFVGWDQAAATVVWGFFFSLGL